MLGSFLSLSWVEYLPWPLRNESASQVWDEAEEASPNPVDLTFNQPSFKESVKTLEQHNF